MIPGLRITIIIALEVVLWVGEGDFALVHDIDKRSGG